MLWGGLQGRAGPCMGPGSRGRGRDAPPAAAAPAAPAGGHQRVGLCSPAHASPVPALMPRCYPAMHACVTGRIAPVASPAWHASCHLPPHPAAPAAAAGCRRGTRGWGCAALLRPALCLPSCHGVNNPYRRAWQGRELLKPRQHGMPAGTRRRARGGTGGARRGAPEGGAL